MISTLSSSAESIHRDSESNHAEPGTIDGSILSDPAQQSILEDLQSKSDLVQVTQSRLHAALDSLEFKMDSFAEGMHKIVKFQEDVGELADRVLEEAAGALEKREAEGLERAGMQKVGIGDVLRSLSRIT